MLRFLVVCLLAVALQGCASGPSLEQRPYYQGPAVSSSNLATVYFFREHHPVGEGVTQNISIKGDLIGALPSGGYLIVQVNPGVYNVRSKRAHFLQGDLSDAEFEIDIEAGKTYFFAQERSSMPYRDERGLSKVKQGGFKHYIQYYFRWAKVPQNEAEERMKYCRLVPVL